MSTELSNKKALQDELELLVKSGYEAKSLMSIAKTYAALWGAALNHLTEEQLAQMLSTFKFMKELNERYEEQNK